MENKTLYSLIISIVNRGYSDEVMDAAREAGAKGGTVMYAHGSGLHEKNSFFGLSIHPEREVVMIIASNETRPAIMQSIVKRVGMDTEGAGITFSLPVSDVRGIARLTNTDIEK